jgi:hypothetical protein
MSLHKDVRGRWGTHYETIPHDCCFDTDHCDCECKACMDAYIQANPSIVKVHQRTQAGCGVCPSCEQGHPERCRG